MTVKKTSPSDQPTWMGKVPADMTIPEMTDARGWFNQHGPVLVERGQRFLDAASALNRALVERMAIPYDADTPAPAFPVFSLEEYANPV